MAARRLNIVALKYKTFSIIVVRCLALLAAVYAHIGIDGNPDFSGPLIGH